MDEGEERPVFGFGLDYGNELIYCEAVMQHDHYEILFNGAWIAAVTYTDEMEWIQSSGGILPQSIVNEIGYRIVSQYN